MKRLALLVLLLAACGTASEEPKTVANAPDTNDSKDESNKDESGGESRPAFEVADDDEPATPDPAEDPLDAPPAKPVTLAPGCTQKATLAGHPAWFFFTRPDKPCTGKAGSGLDTHVTDELRRLIDSVPAGERIDGHIFSISVDGVAKALVDAQTRGVDVWISTDGAVADSTDPSKTQYLDQLAHKVYCKSAGYNGCVSSASGSISHTKLFVFSKATLPDGAVADDVIWLGSANQTYASGQRLYNNTLTLGGDTALYGDFRKYLDDLYMRRTTTNYYDTSSGRGHLLRDSADVYISPDLDSDLVVNRLDDYTPDATCEVRVMQASIRDSRLDVVDRLVTMKKGGCTITVVADTVEPTALSRLKGAGIPVKHHMIHDKVFVVKSKGTYRVYTGSHNLSGSSAHKYDEIFVKLAAENDAAHPVYDIYVTHFKDAYDSATAL